MPQVLYFMGIKPTLADGTYSSDVRCLCLTQANLRAVVRAGAVVEAGCPVCKREYPCEVTKVGSRVEIGFFPPGTVVIV